MIQSKLKVLKIPKKKNRLLFYLQIYQLSKIIENTRWYVLQLVVR